MVSRSGDFDLVCACILEAIRDRIPDITSASAAIFLEALRRALISSASSSVRTRSERSRASAGPRSSGPSANSTSCSARSISSRSLASLASADAISLPMLSSCEFFRSSAAEMSADSSRPDSIFLSSDRRLETDRLSADRSLATSSSAFLRIFDASSFFPRSRATVFSSDAIKSHRVPKPLKLWT